MKDDGRKDVGSDVMDVEKDLERLAPVAAPPGLRERVMDRAVQSRKGAALTPRLWILAAACSIVIVALLAIDPLMARHEDARLAAVIDGRQTSRPTGKEAADVAEILDGYGTEGTRMARLRSITAAALRKEQGRHFAEARMRLKEWLDNETYEDLN